MNRCVPARRGICRVLVMASLYLGAMASAEAQSIENDHEVALKYYLSLGQAGVADAQLALGDLYRQGEVVPRDLIASFAWYYLAAQQGVEEAIDPMNEVLREIPESRWEEAKVLAEQYAQLYIP